MTATPRWGWKRRQQQQQRGEIYHARPQLYIPPSRFSIQLHPPRWQLMTTVGKCLLGFKRMRNYTVLTTKLGLSRNSRWKIRASFSLVMETVIRGRSWGLVSWRGARHTLRLCLNRSLGSNFLQWRECSISGRRGCVWSLKGKVSEYLSGWDLCLVWADELVWGCFGNSVWCRRNAKGQRSCRYGYRQR